MIIIWRPRYIHNASLVSRHLACNKIMFMHWWNHAQMYKLGPCERLALGVFWRATSSKISCLELIAWCNLFLFHAIQIINLVTTRQTEKKESACLKSTQCKKSLSELFVKKSLSTRVKLNENGYTKIYRAN